MQQTREELPLRIADNIHLLFKGHENRLTNELAVVLKRNKGLFSLEDCRFLFASINRVLRHSEGFGSHETSALFALAQYLQLDTSTHGPFDDLGCFILEFGSEEAQQVYIAKESTDLRAEIAVLRSLWSAVVKRLLRI